MNKITLAVVTTLFLNTFANAQNGLENIVVEKYYVSDANDSIGSDAISAMPGSLPVGSVTYRIYADMLPGYKFEAAYGIDNPLHELHISTTTLFYNNEDRGATTPNGINNNFMNHNTVMLDSWLSVGASSSTKTGIPKSDDNGLATVVNIDGLLINNDITAGIPLTVEDGLIAAPPQPVTVVGISNEIEMFDNQNDGTNGPIFSTINGSWASLNGSYGADSIDNKVLIAQITTNGNLCFELNIQIGTPTGGVENYVAKNPVGNEISIPSLSYCSNLTGINDVHNPTYAFNIFSNPTKDLFTMNISTTKESINNSYAIYDLTGRKLFSKKLGEISGNYSETIDISALSTGQYFVELTMDGIASAKKIIKN